MSKRQPQVERGEKAILKLYEASKIPEVKKALPDIRRYIQDNHNELQYCPFCSTAISDPIITYTVSTAVYALWKIKRWCEEQRRHEFSIDEVADFLTHTQYANLNHLIRFGGIFYRPVDPKTGQPHESKYYGLNMARARQCLASEWKIPIQIKVNRFTGERLETIEGFIKDLPQIQKFIDENGIYNPPEFGAAVDAPKVIV